MSSTPARPARRRFRCRLWPTVITAAGLVLLLGLGTWQVERLGWKTELIRQAEEGLAAPAVDLPDDAGLEGLDFRHVSVRGTYLHDAAIGFGLSAVQGEPGGRLVTPLRLDDGRIVLVDRGWLPEALLPPRTPPGLQPSGEVDIEGVARWRGGGKPGWLTPTNEPDKRRWFGWDLPALEQALGMSLLPVEIVLERTEGTGELPKTEPVTIDLPNNHLGYAITWYGLAAALLAIYLLSSMTQPDSAQT